MTKRIASLISGLVLACGLAAFTGSALAGNGHGNGQDKSTTASADQATVDQNAGAQPGVKPDSSTAKGNKPTTCSTGGGTGSTATCTSSGSNAATAQTAGKSDQSKKYGNGKTAAQIANSRGAPAGTQVYGPGNSQPHKVWDCKRHHRVDVHAVKSYSTTSCSETAATTGATTGNSSSQNTSGSTSSVSTAPAATSNASSSSSVSASSNSSPSSNTTPTTGAATGRATGSTHSGGLASSAPQSTAAGGVLGVTASGGSSAPAGGVLGAIASAGSGVLPFTGLSLSLVVLLAALLLSAGFVLRREGRATA